MLNIFKMLVQFGPVAQSSPTLCDPWTAAHQAPLPMGFSRQELWSGFLYPPPGVLPNSGINPVSLASPALAGGFFITSAAWEAHTFYRVYGTLLR